MSSGAIIAVAVAAVVVLAVVGFAAVARRRDGRAAGFLSRETRARDRLARKGAAPVDVEPSEPAPLTGRDFESKALALRSEELEPAPAAPPAPYVPPDAESMGVTRRQFFNRSIVAMMSVSLAGFGASLIAFLWPKKGGGFGSKISIGKVEDVQASIAASHGFYYVPDGRAWITAYPKDSLPKAQKVYPAPVFAGMRDAGIVALYQKCPHLGCRVPQCESSQWFECPCHGSQYNRVGEKKGGPAPRGMDRFSVTVSNDVITIDTGAISLGPPIGTNTTGQEAEGSHCIGTVGGHG